MPCKGQSVVHLRPARAGFGSPHIHPGLVVPYVLLQVLLGSTSSPQDGMSVWPGESSDPLFRDFIKNRGTVILVMLRITFQSSCVEEDFTGAGRAEHPSAISAGREDHATLPVCDTELSSSEV